MLHGVLFFGVGPMPVLGAGRYVRYVTLDCIRRLAPALLHPPASLEEVEHLLSTVGVPERSRAYLEGHPIGGELAGLVGGNALEICSAGEIVGRSLLARYVVRVLEK